MGLETVNPYEKIRNVGPLPTRVREKARDYVVGMLGFTEDGEKNPSRFPEIRDILEYLDLAWREEPNQVRPSDIRVGDQNPGGFVIRL